MKATIIEKCSIRPISRKDWETVGTIHYVDGEGRHITVPSGFITDLASVPRVLWSVVPPFGTYTYAAIIHDYLYRQGGTSRVVADATFAEVMEVEGTDKFTRLIVYLSVRMFGWISFKKKNSRK